MSSIYITNFPNPVKVIAARCIVDKWGRPWNLILADSVARSPTLYLVYRGDLAHSLNFGMRYLGRRDVWFRTSVKDFLYLSRLIPASSVDPRETSGIMFRDLKLGWTSGRLISPPSWSRTWISVFK